MNACSPPNQTVRVSVRQVEAAKRELDELLSIASAATKQKEAEALKRKAARGPKARAKETSRQKAERRAIQYVGLIYLKGARDGDVARLFPGSTRNQRYQWKRRVVDALWKKASPNLKIFLKHAAPCVMVRRATDAQSVP